MKKINNLYVIDDDKIYQFLLKNLFKQNNIQLNISFFNNGVEAIEYISSNSDKADKLPDLILLDVNMPVMNGWQFLEEYSKLAINFSKTAVIYMISSSNNFVDIKRAKGYGGLVKDYLLKPLSKEDLQKIFIQ